LQGSIPEDGDELVALLRAFGRHEFCQECNGCSEVAEVGLGDCTIQQGHTSHAGLLRNPKAIGPGNVFNCGLEFVTLKLAHSQEGPGDASSRLDLCESIEITPSRLELVVLVKNQSGFPQPVFPLRVNPQTLLDEGNGRAKISGDDCVVGFSTDLCESSDIAVIVRYLRWLPEQSDQQETSKWHDSLDML
jgi:hypothetical protein